MPEAHSKFSASSFAAAMACPGKRVMERGLPDRSSSYADEGTAAHAVLEAMLSGAPLPTSVSVNGTDWPVTDEMLEAVSTTDENVRAIAGPDALILPEQRVCYARYLSVSADDAWGTADVIVVRDSELQVHDLKYGKGVEVDAEHNVQMMLYGLGALEACQGILGEFETVRLVIHQPRIKSAPSEWTVSVTDLEAWGFGAARSSVCTQLNAEGADSGPWGEFVATFLHPNDKSCRFCKAKATCPALRAEALVDVVGFKPADPQEFEVAPIRPPAAETDAAWLAAVMARADLIEDWLKAIRAETERRLLAGEPVPGFKLVQGRRGARQWADPKAAEALLRETFRLPIEKAFDLKLISPTSAEKLHKAGEIGPRQWPKAVSLITQPDGKPSVAPDTDPRPALDVRPAADDFESIPAADAAIA
jgi:hypothetical protein